MGSVRVPLTDIYNARVDLQLKRAGLIVATESASTEVVTAKISSALWGMGLATKTIDVNNLKSCALQSLDFLILGSPVHSADKPFDGWAAYEYKLCDSDLSGKTVALFGMGDQVQHPDSFLDSVGWLYSRARACGATVIGGWPTTGYSFNHSKAVTEDGSMFYGLALDEHNQSSLTDYRIANWVAYIAYEFASFQSGDKRRNLLLN